MRRALVTGAGRGIGAAIAARLAADGAEVVLADIDGVAAEQHARTLGHTPIELDVTDVRAVASAVGALGPLAILVNNAGADDSGYFTEVTPARWRHALAVNLEGVLTCTHAALPAMQRAGYGRIVNIASEAVRIGAKGNAPYAAAKGGVIAFTKSIARENGATASPPTRSLQGRSIRRYCARWMRVRLRFSGSKPSCGG